MYFVHIEPDHRCSKCGSINRFFNRMDANGYNYKECADCGHSNKPPVTTCSGNGTVYVAAPLPKYQDY